MYITHFDTFDLCGLVGMGRRKLRENMDEFVQEELTLHTKEEVFEVGLVQVGRPAAVAPKLHCRDMHIFFFHIGLDSSQLNPHAVTCCRKNHRPVIWPELTRLKT